MREGAVVDYNVSQRVLVGLGRAVQCLSVAPIKIQSNLDIAPLFVTTVGGGISRVAVSQNTRYSDISVHTDFRGHCVRVAV